MIRFKEVTFVYPSKDVLDEISFDIEQGDHAVLIGSNGSGKSTLVRLMLNPDIYTYEGDIMRQDGMRISHVDQFVEHEERDITAYDFLAEPFARLQSELDRICSLMADESAPEDIYDRYQSCLDEMESVDAYNYDSNIHKELAVAGLSHIAEVSVNRISGGEYKLLSIIRSMLMKPQLLVMDEPDVFLDFENLVGLMKLINDYDGTVLAITHNRLLLSQCFDKVLHLENQKLQQFPGSYAEYSRAMLETKLEMHELTSRFDDFIAEQRVLVEKMRKEATETTDSKKGKQLRARSSYLDRIIAMREDYPFLETDRYDFSFPDADEASADEVLITITDYSLSFEREILKDVNFEVRRGDKLAFVGANGTGKTSLLKDVYSMLAERMPGEVKMFSQIYDDAEDTLSGGERNLRQLEEICESSASVLILDEPTSHLDIYAQAALERAIKSYKGTVLMVSHDFFAVTGCADRIMLLENGSLREQSPRAYRKSIYKKYFDSDIFEAERIRKETEMRLNALISDRKYDDARALLSRTENL